MVKNIQEIKHYVTSGTMALLSLGSSALAQYDLSNGYYITGTLNLLATGIAFTSAALHFSRALDLTRKRGGLERSI